MQISRKCYECKESFRKTELVEYFSASGKTSHWYCPKCLKEKQSRENFSNKVCEIFGIISPGPRLWTERKRLQNKYGYTDDTLIDCLEYIYKVEKKKILAESLCLINPVTIDKMIQYKKSLNVKANNFSRAMQQEMEEFIVPIKQEENNKIELNPDDWLKDD